MRRPINSDRIIVITAMGLGVLAMNVMRPILPLYLTSIGVSPKNLGLMFSVSMVGMVFGEVSWGWVADKIGVKLPMSVGTTIFGLITPFFVFTQNISSLFIVFLFWGLPVLLSVVQVGGILGMLHPHRKRPFLWPLLLCCFPHPEVWVLSPAVSSRTPGDTSSSSLLPAVLP